MAQQSSPFHALHNAQSEARMALDTYALHILMGEGLPPGNLRVYPMLPGRTRPLHSRDGVVPCFDGVLTMRHHLFPLIDIPEPLLWMGFSTDDVYGNDCAVRLTRDDLSLWVDHEDPQQRETMGPRFAIHTHNECMDATCQEVCFEDEESLYAYLETLHIFEPCDDDTRAFGPHQSAPAWWTR